MLKCLQNSREAYHSTRALSPKQTASMSALTESLSKAETQPSLALPNS